jgi:hypothetical protein
MSSLLYIEDIIPNQATTFAVTNRLHNNKFLGGRNYSKMKSKVLDDTRHDYKWLVEQRMELCCFSINIGSHSCIQMDNYVAKLVYLTAFNLPLTKTCRPYYI